MHQQSARAAAGHTAIANNAPAKSSGFIVASNLPANRVAQSRRQLPPNLLNLKLSAAIVSQLRT
ncbi:MAG: hypothetical protein WBW35_22185 [Xanthobacteraceae bacterium]